MTKAIDLTGKKFGRWLVVDQNGVNKYGNKLWKCLCECGSESVVLGSKLYHGDSKSCGCLRKDLVSARMKSLWGSNV